MTTIKLDIEYSSLGETTESEANNFANELRSRIVGEYPDAAVSVGIDLRGFGGVNIEADSLDEQDSITQRIADIQRDVWERGSWHTES